MSMEFFAVVEQTTFGSLFIGGLYMSTGVLWLLSAKSSVGTEHDRGQLVDNGVVVGYGVVSAFAGLVYVVASLLYFCCCEGTGDDHRRKV